MQVAESLLHPEKETGEDARAPAPLAPSRENVINLMDALRRSIAGEQEACGGDLLPGIPSS
jgi:non-homologous end joining protein Ku